MNVEMQENSIRLERAVRALCPVIRCRVESFPIKEFAEDYLRQEMAACILSTQVRFEMVDQALARLATTGLFGDERWNEMTDSAFEQTAYRALAGKTSSRQPAQGSYRFPHSRASQLTRMRRAVKQAGQSLTEWLDPTRNAKVLRNELVSRIPGFGPKLASMFLRNCGLSYDLAVLDTHTLRFMVMRGLLSTGSNSVTTLGRYEKTEFHAVAYAASLGHPVGYLDWAIWATMRAAKELRL
ncbi:MAG: hypothetical protein Q8M11_09000 [Sulfuritalea sp.]|nr:hypothetical protein [Sulfuritalea sp.]MDP1981571.1 hypothetical protein [Sulfuritalea sp.]